VPISPFGSSKSSSSDRSPAPDNFTIAMTERTACLAVLYSARELIEVRSLQRKPLAGL
jgi:hypothetical protein